LLISKHQLVALLTQMRIYLIGAGVIARLHAAASQHLPDSQGVMLSVADPNPAALQDFLKNSPQARVFSDARAMLAEPAQPDDIVIVATPPFTHYELSCAAIESGRHVLCEKPLAMTSGEAHRMLAAARAKQRLLGCCSDRFLGIPTTAEAKRLVQTGALGKPYHFTFVQRTQRNRTGIEYQPSTRWFLDRSKNGGGTVMDWGPYDFATINDVLAPVRVEVLTAWMANPTTAPSWPADMVFNVEEHAGASLRYHLGDGTVVAVTYERAACTHGKPLSGVEIEGERGAVRWDWLMTSGKGELTRSFDKDGKVESTTAVMTDEGGIHLHHKPLVYFARRIRGEASPALINEQAVFNFCCLRAVYECVETGRAQTVTWGEKL